MAGRAIDGVIDGRTRLLVQHRQTELGSSTLESLAATSLLNVPGVVRVLGRESDAFDFSTMHAMPQW